MSLTITESPRLWDQVKEITGGTVRDFVETMTELVKKNAPYDTGNLRSSIDWEVEHSSLSFRVFSATGYGAWLEFGTRHIAPRMYFHRSFSEAVLEFS